MISSPKETICDHLLWNNRKLIQGNQKGYFIIVQPLSTHLLTFCVMKREACLKHFCSTPKSYAAAKSLQSCLTLCDPMDGSPPGSPVSGILQARTLEWVAISFSNVWKWKVKVKSLSRVQFLATSWTAAYQAPPSMGFSRQDYWSGVPLPSLGKPYRCTFIELRKFTLFPIFKK